MTWCKIEGILFTMDDKLTINTADIWRGSSNVPWQVLLGLEEVDDRRIGVALRAVK